MNLLKIILAAVLVLFMSSCSRFLPAWMRFSQLKSKCTESIQQYGSFDFKSVKVTKVEILGWYRDKDKAHPLKIDCALCWASFETEKGPRWAVVHMVRSFSKLPGQEEWHNYFVFDVGNDWVLFYDRPPKNSDIYSAFQFFQWAPAVGWERYDSSLDSTTWKRLIGEPPARTF